MELDELCAFIEELDRYYDNHIDLWSILGLQSTTTMFIKRMEEHKDFQRLVELVKESEDNEAKLLYRAYFILNAPFDIKYANPMDTFLAVYLYALATVEDNNARIWSLI